LSESGTHRERGDSKSTALAQLHIAEYEALMTRNSNIMTLQFSLLPAAVLIVALFAGMWSMNWDHNELIIWAVYTSLLVVSIVWTGTLWEIYNNVSYVERELKPLISDLCGSTAFWKYERHQARLRGTNPLPWELAQPILAGVLFAAAVFLTWPFTSNLRFKQWKYPASLFTLLLNKVLWSLTFASIRLRRDFSTAEIVEPPRHEVRLPVWLAPLITLGIGIIPLIVITSASGTFWLHSRVAGPLIAVPSVLIGDSLLLPILNWRIARFLTACLAIETLRKAVFRRFWIALLCSSLVSVYASYKWTHDQFFGFIDPTFGQLSFAGWWHLGFTIIEMTLVFVFVLMWQYTTRHRFNEKTLQLATMAWNIFLLYALLSIADFIVLHLYLLPRRGVPDYTPVTAWEGLLVIPFWLVVRLFLGRSRPLRPSHATR